MHDTCLEIPPPCVQTTNFQNLKLTSNTVCLKWVNIHCWWTTMYDTCLEIPYMHTQNTFSNIYIDLTTTGLLLLKIKQFNDMCCDLVRAERKLSLFLDTELSLFCHCQIKSEHHIPFQKCIFFFNLFALFGFKVKIECHIHWNIAVESVWSFFLPACDLAPLGT